MPLGCAKRSNMELDQKCRMGRPSPQEGMPIAAGADPEFAQFMERAKQDPMMSQFIDNAGVMQNIFEMYKQQLSTGRMY